MRSPSAPDSGGLPAAPPALARRTHNFRWLRSLLLLAALIVLAEALVGEHSLSTAILARRQNDVAGAQLDALRLENARMRDEGRRLRDEPQTIEYVARKDLGLARRGELLVVLK